MIGLTKTQMAREVALDLPDGAYVNLGIGLPILVAAHLDPAREVVVHSENGILGMGPSPAPGHQDPNLIDAGKAPVTLVQGGSYIGHADSFAIIRGGHLDVSVMGALQVSGAGDLANWWSGEGIPGVGGAMDLAVGAREVLVIMRHVTATGDPKIVAECSLPITARGIVSRIYTEYGVFEPTPSGLVVVGLAEGTDVDALQSRTGVALRFAGEPLTLPRAA
ncbi:MULTISPECIES: 3-oxoacid CoA-transferase subunit B [Microbacterium]|uniref:3-oxoadipate CoA-transferase, beta subunit n=1 Tax=Microbacterium saccharophilum TaxID=1213358 RepID=A0A7Z7CYK5_9MICO|nr:MULTISPECIES: 3-oxoacid CoA-transferase subunit B [Microbacterium]SFI60789.1 3-oxoadipate CoA-transferase, beta subunit [Microbacterium saccharophilum]